MFIGIVIGFAFGIAAKWAWGVFTFTASNWRG